jgi:hypothetical protein
MAIHDERGRPQGPLNEAGALIIEGRVEALEREQKEEKRRDSDNKQRQLRFNKLLVIFTFGLLVTSAIGDSISIYQSRQARKAADAATLSASSALIGANAATVAADTARNTLDNSKESFRIEQRPYLIPDFPQFVVPPTNPGITSANITLRNIGKTPAVKIRWQLYLVRYRPMKKDAPGATEKVVNFMKNNFQNLTDDLNRGDAAKYTGWSHEDLAPNSSTFSTALLAEPLSASEIPDIPPGNLTLFLVGLARYTDAYNGIYETEFCYFYFGADPTTWHICDNHNTIK